MLNKVAAVIATWFGLGYAPVAPGTVASLAALAIAFLIERQLGWRGWHFGVAAAIGVLPAMWAAGVTARRAGQTDPSMVVVDEVVGQWVALAGVTSFNWKGWLGAFLLFRLFDIWKPGPVRRLEALRGGAGIVADDVAAGASSALVLFSAGCFNLY